MVVRPEHSHADAFVEAKRQFQRTTRTDTGLACSVGFHLGCDVLKLQKPAWTNDGAKALTNEPGIFFSVWVAPSDARRNRANYNVHALKLGQLDRYRIASRDFAEDFRRAFASEAGQWPNVSVDYGPQTLMQGWIVIDSTRFIGDVLGLMRRFETFSPVVDELLARRAKPAGR